MNDSQERVNPESLSERELLAICPDYHSLQEENQKDCGCPMEIRVGYSYVEHGLTITVPGEKYLYCPICKKHQLSPRVERLYEKEKQRKIEEWMFSYIHSFADITHYFYTRGQANRYFTRKRGELGIQDTRPRPADREWRKWCFESNRWYFFANICGGRIYLKKSIWNDCTSYPLTWDASQGLHMPPPKTSETSPMEASLFSRVHSFSDIGRLFYTQRQAEDYVEKMLHSPECRISASFSPEEHLRYIPQKAKICGRAYYLKRSVWRYCRNENPGFAMLLHNSTEEKHSQEIGK